MYSIFITTLSILVLYETLIPAVTIKNDENIQPNLNLNEDSEQIWQVTLDSKEVEKLTLKENFVLEDDEAYIFLKITTNKRYVLYYWLGKSTTIEKKLKAASVVVNLWNQLLDKSVVRSEVPPINRILQGEESEYFRRHFHQISDFQASNDSINSELYEITKNKHGTVKIVLVPLSSLKFDRNKCYVLDAENGIFVYVGNKKQKEITMNLANHIMDDRIYLMSGLDNVKMIYGIQYRSADQLFQIKHVTEAEFSLLVGSSRLIQKSTHITVRTLTKKKLKVYEIKKNNLAKINKSELKTAYTIKKVGCYILKNRKLYYLYVVIGPICYMDSVRYCLQKGEKLAEVPNKWKKVIVVSGHRLPAVFLANFPNFGNIISENKKFRNFSTYSTFTIFNFKVTVNLLILFFCFHE